MSDHDFAQFQRFIHDAAGIHFSHAKKALVGGRLAKRLRQCGLTGYGDYLRLLASGTAPGEVQTAIDLLTTNETYFFREPKHFAHLRELALAARSRARPFRIWSAASSSGEEAYSIAMVLADCLEHRPWEVVGSDISSRVLDRARAGHYSLARTQNIPSGYLKKYCLKGVGPQHGTLLVARSLRERVKFMAVNLNASLPSLGTFDVIFLRNVMIYFGDVTKRQVVDRVVSQLSPGGHLMVGHSESLCGIDTELRGVAPSIYRKV